MVAQQRLARLKAEQVLTLDRLRRLPLKVPCTPK